VDSDDAHGYDPRRKNWASGELAVKLKMPVPKERRGKTKAKSYEPVKNRCGIEAPREAVASCRPDPKGVARPSVNRNVLTFYIHIIAVFTSYFSIATTNF
jgi:hypothetical protein